MIFLVGKQCNISVPIQLFLGFEKYFQNKVYTFKDFKKGCVSRAIRHGQTFSLLFDITFNYML